MNKRGAIWISAVLYMGLGIIILSMILAVGLPAVQKMKDQFTIKETKNLMLVLDENIRTVYQEGPGSQRVVDLKISRGTFEIDDEAEDINWSLSTKIPASQPGVETKEGNLIIFTEQTPVEDQYSVTLSLDYSNFLNLSYGSTQQTISGNTKLSILNNGVIGGGGSEFIEIKINTVQ